jgi:hypothetical protein
VKDTSAHSFTAVRCAGDSVFFHHLWIKTTGIYRDTLPNAMGCDSVVTILLSYGSIVRDTLRLTICSNSSYLFRGIPRTIAGSYSDTLKTDFGCDSIVVLILTVRSTTSKAISAAICIGQYYRVGSKVYTSAGIYKDTLTNAQGCDSVITLSLTVNATSASNRAVTICSSDSIYFNNQYLRKSGTYIDTLRNQKGCDSIVTLALTVRPKRNIALVSQGVLMMATQGFVKYNWYRDSSIVQGETKYFYSPKQTGIYTAVGLDEYSCKYASNAIDYYYSAVSISGEIEWNIYPTPASDKIYIQSSWLKDKATTLSIYNLDGRKMNAVSNFKTNYIDGVENW